MCTSRKKKDKLFCENKVQRKRREPENRILKSGIHALMESGIHGCGIRNPQTWNLESTAWNLESKTLLDYLTWGKICRNPATSVEKYWSLLNLKLPNKGDQMKETWLEFQ